MTAQALRIYQIAYVALAYEFRDVLEDDDLELEIPSPFDEIFAEMKELGPEEWANKHWVEGSSSPST